MPVSIIVGGQFGSEGKGKVSLEIARRAKVPVTVVRVGGPNSGHTAYDRSGRKWSLRQMPAGCVDRNVEVVFPAGSYIDIDVLLDEIEELKFPKERVRISSFARVIVPEHKAWEREAGLAIAIGSTGSGTGGAVIASAARDAANLRLPSFEARHFDPLQKYICDSSEFLRERLRQGCRVIIEGTQGFGLSLLEGGHWPKATARSTTAAGALAEAGLSPIDVDDVTMVLRTFPIRVAGDSGPLTNEMTWSNVAAQSGRRDDIREYTTVTKKLRRVGGFDTKIVRRALDVNQPTRLVLNHLDYIGPIEELAIRDSRVRQFLRRIDKQLQRRVDEFGFSPYNCFPAEEYVCDRR